MSISTKYGLAGAAALAAALVAFQPSVSQAADDNYYEGKTIRFIVGFGAGGGYDTYSRLLAPHLERELGATVLVQNEPGAGGLRALNRFYRAPDDGLQLTIVNGTGASIQQLLGLEQARFDLTKYKQLGIIDHSRWLILMQPDTKFETVKDLMQADRTLNFGGSGKMSALTSGAAMACHTLDIDCNLVFGYKGSSAVSLAVEQGEMDGIYVSETSAFKYAQAGRVKPLATWNRKRSNLFPNVPTVFEQVNLTKEQAWWVDYRATIEGLGRMLVMPPATPDHFVTKMRATVDKLLTDPEVVKSFEKRKRFVKYIPAKEVEEMVNTVLKSVTPEQKAEMKRVVLGEDQSG